MWEVSMHRYPFHPARVAGLAVLASRPGRWRAHPVAGVTRPAGWRRAWRGVCGLAAVCAGVAGLAAPAATAAAAGPAGPAGIGMSAAGPVAAVTQVPLATGGG